MYVCTYTSAKHPPSVGGNATNRVRPSPERAARRILWFPPPRRTGAPLVDLELEPGREGAGKRLRGGVGERVWDRGWSAGLWLREGGGREERNEEEGWAEERVGEDIGRERMGWCHVGRRKGRRALEVWSVRMEFRLMVWEKRGAGLRKG